MKFKERLGKEKLCQELQNSINENALQTHKLKTYKSLHDDVVSENSKLKSEVDRLNEEIQAILKVKKYLNLWLN